MSALAFATVAVGVTVGAFAVYVGNGVLKAKENASRRLVSLQTRSDILQHGFAERALAPVVQKLGSLVLRLTPQGWAARTNKRLVLAGVSERFDANSWAVVRIFAAIAGVVLGLAVQGVVPGLQKVLLLGLALAMGVLGPDAVLARKIDDRRAGMERDLPDIIDLLVISVEAGLGFESALGRVVENVPGELSDEFGRMLQETRVGVRRVQAMRDLAERTDVDDLNSFIMAMNQADTFGVSVSRMLRVQADEIRVRRRQRAQEKAFAAPVKMVFPLVLCIFPSLFVVLLGPAVIQIVESFRLT